MTRAVFFLLIIFFAFPTFAAEPLADYILVEKSKRKMVLMREGKVIRKYPIILGKYPEGPKRQEGDFKTPEGFYYISGRMPNSDYHLALQISYPDQLDEERAHMQGVSPGGRIMIHGLPNDYGERKRKKDWTHGCIAVTNWEIEEMWQLVPDGTPIEIRP